MEKKFIEIKRGSVVVKVYKHRRVKTGKEYTSYVVVDHSQGNRKLRTFSDLQAAKDKAAEIALATAQGKTEVLHWEDSLRVEIRKSLEIVEKTGLSLLPGTQLFAQAVQILGGPDELLQACQFWRTNRPDKPFTPKPVREAVAEYMLRRKQLVSAARFRTETSYLNCLVGNFGQRNLNQIDTPGLEGMLSEKSWTPKTRNDFCSAASLLFQHGSCHDWVPKGYNPVTGIKRLREVPGAIEIFTPEEAKRILEGLAAEVPELVPFYAISCFAGLRKQEVARLTWQQVNSALTTSWIELHAQQTKNREYRTVIMKENLKAWLNKYRKDCGSILPIYWLSPTKTCEDRLKELCRYISRKTRVEWRPNAPRHSFGTYYFKVCKDPGEVVSAMGTSLQKFERNYWHKSRTVTEQMAQDWFNIFPEPRRNVESVPLMTTG